MKMKLNSDNNIQTGSSNPVHPLNILILNQSLPVFPGMGGIEYLNAIHLAALARQIGLVSMVHTAEDFAKSEVFREKGMELYLWESPAIQAGAAVPAPPRLKVRAHRFMARALQKANSVLRRVPDDTLVTRLGFRNLSGPLENALRKRHWHALIVVQSSQAQVIDYLPRQPLSILMMHDIRAVIFDRQASIAQSGAERRRLRRQADFYYQFEKKYLPRYDLVVALSQVDHDWIQQHYRPRNLALIPIPVDAEYFSPAGAEEEIPHRIVFPGLMNHPPNSDAAVYFARDVFPQLRASFPDAEFWIVGKDPIAEVKALEEIPGVRVTGAVPDIRPHLAEAAVLVVPLRFGSGVRQKILEAWSMEKFIVASSVGTEGLEYEDGVNLVVADGPEKMIQVIRRALGEPQWRRQIQQAGRKVAQEHHHPLQIARSYYAAIEKTVRQKREQPPPLMRLVLDLRWMLPGQAGGLEDLARSFLDQLLPMDQHNQYALLLNSSCRYDLDTRDRNNFRIICEDGLEHSFERRLRRGRQALYQRLRLDSGESDEVLALGRLADFKAEVALSFPGYIRPDLYPLRNVLIVPDIQHEFFPQFFSPAALEERRRIYSESICRADHICAISEFTRQTLIQHYGLDPGQVSTTCLAADPIFTAHSGEASDVQIQRLYDLPENYLFFPGHTWRHKNHMNLLAAMVILERKYQMTPQLVCSGGAREAQSEIGKKIQEEGLTGRIRFLGYLPKAEIPALYRSAGCLVFPSFFEGFGMPVLEAMACGCPVVAARAASLPEIAGKAALYADPDDPEGLADAIRQILTDAELRRELVQIGFRQAMRFSWRKFTLEILAVLHRVSLQYHHLKG
jgi:glycosyltransferase involved in cell wall biosynthesis